MLAEVFAERIMAFSSVRTSIGFSRLGAGRTVRESDMGNLGNTLDRSSTLQHAKSLPRKLGRTTKPGPFHSELRVELRKTKERLRHKEHVILGCIRQPGFEI